MNEFSEHDPATLAAADPELEPLLTDAYEAPAVPRSLLRRIDRAVTAEWGRSPKLVDSRVDRLTTAVSRSSRLVKSLPVAASIALVLVLAVMFSGDGRAYGWAAMLEALEKHGVVQIEDTDETRWLSLAEGILGRRTAESTRMLDARRQIVLERQAGADEVYRRSLGSTVSTADRNGLVLGFLLDEDSADGLSSRLAGARLIDESWKQVSVNGAEQIALHVAFETESSERLELAITLDPESQLPTACEVRQGGIAAKSETLSYPTTTVVALAEKSFPRNLSVVDVGEEGKPLLRVAADDPSNPQPQPHVGIAADDRAVAQLPDGTEPQPVADQPPMEGAPSAWQPVRAVDLSRSEVVEQINALLADLWKEQGVAPAPLADNEELLRRVYLDLVGRTPSVNEVRSYLGDASENRYELLVDRLLKSPDHASHLATVWRTFLIPEGVDLTRFGGVEAFDQWLAQRFASDDSYDEVVRSLLLAEGRLSRSGPLLFYSAVKLDANELASRTARVFLGMRLECAQCHDHPFEPWSQQDFWSLAAFFSRISRPRGELETVSTVMRVYDVDRGEVMLPDTDTIVPPKYLDGADIPEDARDAARRQQLARWLTSRDNPYFARATANRVWGHLFGKGIVEPLDDMGTQNPPKSPELLELLAGRFLHSKFSLRELFRTVALTRAYRLSSGAPTVDENRPEWFAQMNVKTLTAEQVYDCITVATLLENTSQAESYAFNIERFGNSSRAAFVQQFRTPAGRRTEYLGGIPQALTLMNGTLIEGATGLSSSGLLKSLEAPFFTNEQRIEVLYMATLSRRPRPSEWKLLRSYITDEATGTELQNALADILWALLNSAEFTLNH